MGFVLQRSIQKRKFLNKSKRKFCVGIIVQGKK